MVTQITKIFERIMYIKRIKIKRFNYVFNHLGQIMHIFFLIVLSECKCLFLYDIL